MQSSALSVGFKGTLHTEIKGSWKDLSPLYFHIFSVEKHTLGFLLLFVMLFPNQLPNTWFWPQAAFIATKHQLTVLVHLLRCPVRCCLLGSLSKLYQNTPRGRKCPIPTYPSFHHTVSALSFQSPVGWIVQTGRDRLVQPSAQRRANIKFRLGCSMLFPVRLHSPRKEILLCLWASTLVLNHSPFEQSFSLSKFFRQNFPCCCL